MNIIICFFSIISSFISLLFLYISNIKGDDKKDDRWAESYKKANEFISKLNRTEKVNLLFGTENMRTVSPYVPPRMQDFDHHCDAEIDAFENNEVSFKTVCFKDGSTGIRASNGTGISWQSTLNLASTFNKELIYKVGKAQGEEGKEKGVNVILSPNVNIMRTPQGGRIWEAFGDDPFHTGACASELIKGIQDAGVIANLKHFVGNEVETYRKASSSNIPKNAFEKCPKLNYIQANSKFLDCLPKEQITNLSILNRTKNIENVDSKCHLFDLSGVYNVKGALR